MRLIDADVLIGTIEKYKFGAISSESEREYTREIMLCFVNGSPTAYDVEKVVVELTKQAFCRFENCENCHTCEPVIDEKKAKDIVRKGGVE